MFMKRFIEVLCSVLLFSSYLKFLSLSGAASVFMIRRWSMLRPLNIVFINDFVDCLVLAFIALTASILIAYSYRTLPSILFIILSTLSVSSSIFTLYFYSAFLSLLTGFLTVIYVTLIKRDVKFISIFRSILTMLIIIEALSMLGWILYLIHGGINPYTEPVPLQDLEAKIVFSISSLTPVLATLFMFSTVLFIIVKPLTPLEGSKPAELLEKLKVFLRDLVKEMDQYVGRFNLSSTILLSSAFILPVAAIFLLYTPIVNPSNMTISVDIAYYVNYLNQLDESSRSGLEILYNLLSRDRPLTLLIIYSLSHMSGIDFKTVSTYLPVILSPLLMFSIFYLSSTLFKNKMYPSLTCYLSATGPFTTASLYGGFLANWLGLSLTYLSLTLLIKSIEKDSVILLAASILLSILSHLAHPVPWNFLIASIILASILIAADKNRDNRILRLIGAFIIVNIMFDILKTRVLGFSGATQVAESIVSTELSLDNLINFWPINVFTIYFHVGGAFNLPPSYFFALLGMILFNFTKSLKLDILKMWVLAGLPLYLLGPDYVQARTLQNIPLDFFISGGILTVSSYLSFKDKISSRFFIASIYLLYLNNLLRFIVNLPF